jgi:diguanylate cyclase (GGDEF)-like protein
LVATEPGIRCYLGAPLTTPDGYNVGAICVVGTEPRCFTAADREVLANFARLVVSQLELRMLARRDGLTGALTRRAFEVAMRATLDAVRRDNSPCSLVIQDLDHFKVVNDRFGHPAGDEVLRATARVIQRALRPSDAWGRLGGEEFALLLKGRNPEEAWSCAEAIRRGVMTLRVPCLGDHVVTISGGVATWQSGFCGTEGWLAAADVALYAAKRNGRNQVLLAA